MLALRRIWQATLYASVLLLSIFLAVDIVLSDDAEVSQNDNLQDQIMDAGNVDVTQTDNMQLVVLKKNDVDVTYTSNLVRLRLKSNEVDISQSQNLVASRLDSMDTDITQNNNLLALRLGPNNADVTLNNNLIALLLEQSLTPSVSITSLSTTDQSGNLKTDFKAGEVAQINFVVTNIGSVDLKSGLISVIIVDPSETPLFLAYTFDDINKASSKEFIFGLTIPFEASLGTYTVKALVFTNWPSEGGEGLAVETTAFNVTD